MKSVYQEYKVQAAVSVMFIIILIHVTDVRVLSRKEEEKNPN